MCILDKAESQDIATNTSAAWATVSNKNVAQYNKRLNILNVSRKVADIFYTQCLVILYYLLT